MSKRAKVILLVIPPVVAIAALMGGLWAHDREYRRLDDEQDKCIRDCRRLWLDRWARKEGRAPTNQERTATVYLDTPLPASALGQTSGEFDPDGFLCMGTSGNYGDGCERASTTGYDTLGLFLAGAIGIVWAPWAAWLLILAMVRSVVKTVRDASNPDKK